MEHLSASPAATDQIRVLVVEPDHDTRRRYVDVLGPLGCEAVEAADGREALVEALVPTAVRDRDGEPAAGGGRPRGV